VLSVIDANLTISISEIPMDVLNVIAAPHLFELSVTYKLVNVNANLESQVKSVKDVILVFGICKQMDVKGVNVKLNLLSEQAVGKKTDNVNACPESLESIVMDAQEIGCWLSTTLGL